MIKKVLYVFSLVLLISFLVIDVANATALYEGTLAPILETGISGTLVAAPTFSPAAGTYTATQSVTLTSAGTTGICYTVDGTTPVCSALGTTCTTGTLYSSAVSVASTKTVTAISCYSNNRQSSTASAVYTISVATSGGGGGGGGGGETVSMPTTVNGSVTATPSLGGQTSLTNSDGTQATTRVEQGTLSASTVVAITSLTQTSIQASGMIAGIGSGQTMVGNLYNYTATVGSTNVTTFTKTITITMSYTNSQIQGLDESNLKIYYWNTTTSQWIALTSTVDKVNNIITATTTHFTYFAIIGGAAASGGTSNLIDGDIVRASDAPGMEKFDVYIIKLINGKKYRRLVLSPHVFESYGHLKWSNIKIITNTEMQTYTISDLVRCSDAAQKVNDPKVYRLYPDGDTGAKRWMNMTANVFSSKYDWDAIYIINKVDRDAYTTGQDLTS